MLPGAAVAVDITYESNSHSDSTTYKLSLCISNLHCRLSLIVMYLSLCVLPLPCRHINGIAIGRGRCVVDDGTAY